jgi:hypothetical protein
MVDSTFFRVKQYGRNDPPSPFVPVTPCRIVDTRWAIGALGGPTMAANSTRSFPVPLSPCGIPADARAYALNVTVVPGGPLGYLSIWPTGEPQPFVSTLNSIDGRVKANAAIVPAGENGAVSVFVTNATDVVLDITGYFTGSFAAANGRLPIGYYPLTPCRVSDTRWPTGPLGGPIFGVKETRTLPVQQSSCGIPPNALAYALNFTVVPRGSLWYLAAAPTGASMPVVSTLNSYAGQIVANAAIVPAGSNGSIDVYATNETEVVIDINGYFADSGSSPLYLYNMTPCRVFDTRRFGPDGAFAGKNDVVVTPAMCGVPPGARAFALNATVVPTSGRLGYLSLWPSGEPQPLVSTLNALDGSIVANAAMIPSNNGWITAFTTDKTDLILDISGYFAPYSWYPNP